MTNIGVRFGIERGRGRTAAPLVSAILGAVIAVAALTAALTFGANLEQLTGSPSQQGWNWDVLVGNPNDLSDRIAQAAPLLASNLSSGRIRLSPSWLERNREMP